MSSDMQKVLAELQKLSIEQTSTRQQLSDVSDFLEKRFTEADAALDKRFQEAEIAFEWRVIDCELRHDARLQLIERAAADLVDWHGKQDDLVEALQLRIGKLDKYWSWSVLDTTSGTTASAILDTSPPVKLEPYAATSSACYTYPEENQSEEDRDYDEELGDDYSGDDAEFDSGAEWDE